MLMRAYVVDDERLAVERLKRLLRATGRVEIAGATTDPEEALTFLRASAVDVLFLDIQMPGLTGFELLERLDTDVVVVFTTAYDRYALEAFNVNSVDYLLKPIEAERLDQALDKLERVRGTGPRVLYGDASPVTVQESGQGPDIRALARELAAQLTAAGSPYRTRIPAPGPLERIASRVGERTTVVDVARVTHFYSKDKLTFAVVNGRDHAIDHTLAELEARLDPRRFVRIHRATIVNVPLVQEIFPGVDSGLLVRLKDDKKTELSVARDRVRALKERLGI
jgi:two-component system, LytTR family, response regulator